MLHHPNKKIKVWINVFPVLKRVFFAVTLIGYLLMMSSCTYLTKHLDKKTGFSKQLAQVENNVRNENWAQAKTNLDDSKKAWEKIKPFMQLDIDHDYIKDIEDNFTILNGYIETQDKSNSLPTIMLIEDTWENIDSL